MQIIKSFFKLLVFICPFFAAAQSTFLPPGDKGYHFVERLEIKQRTNTNLNFSAAKPFNRKYIVAEVEYIDSMYKQNARPLISEDNQRLKRTKVDEYDMNSLLMNNTEWVTGSKESF